jgi:putative SOS response-associated peptidase YedK
MLADLIQRIRCAPRRAPCPSYGRQGQYYYHLRDDQPFAFAGLWDQWNGPEGPVDTCAIITTDANELPKAVHDRMPVILNADTGRAWLDPRADAADLHKLLRPYACGDLDAYPVSTRVNNPRNHGPELIQQLTL